MMWLFECLNFVIPANSDVVRQHDVGHHTSYLSFPLRIGPLCFQAGGRKR